MKETLANLRKAIADEIEAYSDYSKWATIAQKEGLPEVAEVFLHIRPQEGHHRDELKAALAKLKG